ncbi:MAG TPA: PH domain-containing protein [Dehalococcoidia bacterium]|nr:PH domain-containing protein [Dehalococcoidia bacterium]
MTVFRPGSNIGALYGAAVVLVCYALAALMLFKGLTQEVEFSQLFPLLAGGFFLGLGSLYLYWTWGCRSLRYVVDRNALSIRWGGIQQVVPLHRIERLVPAEAGENPSIEGVNWPGHHVGRGFVPIMGGDVLFYSGHRDIGEVLYLQTDEETYAISVPDHIVFAETIQAAQARGPLFEQRQAVHRWGIPAQSFWIDANARLLAAALIASFVAVLAYVLHEYPGLPQSVPLRFPALGGIVRVSDKSELLDIPRSGLGFMAANLTLAVLLHSWERMVGYVLLLAGIAVQVMLLVAAVVAVA